MARMVEPTASSAPDGGATEVPPASALLRGTPVSPGLALGVVHRKDHDLSNAPLDRIPRDQVEAELNRFHKALVDARTQLVGLKGKLAGKVPVDDARILDVHLAYLKDSVFLADVENLILGEHLCLEAAIAKVISDFDRIFRLVQNESLRERAVDLRDVGIRVLRHLEKHRDAEAGRAVTRPADYVLAARELSIVDMFNLQGERVLGIMTEAGALTSHAAILARSMRIPTITAVAGLLDTVREGDFVILDASEGVARVNPDEVVRAQYKETPATETEVDDSAESEAGDARTRDGSEVKVAASCGNLPEVEQVRGTRDIGLYRTELLFLVDKEPPSLETLQQHYAAVVSAARTGTVTFRLLDVDSSLGVPYLHPAREPNPALGRAGVRTLLSRDLVLRRQLQAILRAGAGHSVRVAIPFVTDTGEVRRVKEILFEEKLELRKSREAFAEKLGVGVVIETPAALLGARDLAREADFLLVGLDGFTQHLLAVDRDNDELRSWFEHVHPCVLRALRTLVEVCEELGKPLGVFGVTAMQSSNVPFLVGVGLREFCIEPSAIRRFLADVGRLTTRGAQRAAQTASASSCQAETLSLVDGWRHGYARG
jgi:phosphoenolpyruvate-protein phosphotransferase